MNKTVAIVDEICDIRIREQRRVAHIVKICTGNNILK